MKLFPPTMTCVLVCLYTLASLAHAQAISHPGFELQSLSPDWKANPTVYQLDHTVKRSGSTSVRWQNDDPAQYLHCTQNIDLDPTIEYVLTAWVKTQDVKDGYATIAVEFYTGDKFHSGMYPKGIAGTTDWTQVKTDSFVLPQGVTRAQVLCYARRGATGKAWFDDASLVPIKHQLMQSTLRYPAYRGLMKHGDASDIQLRLKLAEHLPEKATLNMALLDQTGQVKKTLEKKAQTGVSDFVIASGVLAEGHYTLQVLLHDADHKQLDQMSHRIKVVDALQMPRIIIDQHQRLVIDGKPTLPIGVYGNVRVSDADLKLLQNSPVTCLLAYGTPSTSLLDRLEAHDLKLIASVKDYYLGHKWTPKQLKHVDDEARLMRPLVKSLRDHPALLAWYLNDELPLSYMDRFKAHYQWVVEDDPAHPAMTILMRPHQIDRYLHTADVLGTDPYPLPHKPIALAGQWTKQTVMQTRNTRPVWQVVQAFNWQNYRTQTEHAHGRTPTQAELRNMIWQCLTNGANGILLYSLYDMQRNPDIDFQTYWPQVTDVLGQVQAHAPMLLSVAPTPLVTFNSDAMEHLSMRVTRWQGMTYAFVVSTSDKPVTVNFTCQQPVVYVRERFSGQVLGVNHSQTWQDTFKPLDVRIYQIQNRQ